MNKLERIIVATYYENFILNGMHGDPVGGYTDMNGLFKELREQDKELDNLLSYTYDKLPDRL